ncbi:MamI family restriction endonuclease [Streptomyces sp. P3]|uniref:MamI family restriction endonuclease n=1 Tax=Streptomyces sp. P3 TaxID=2135430 RepID=UPI00131ED1C7|nr:MamI family restriction endonuclease [Streptomyces sp. P3]
MKNETAAAIALGITKRRELLRKLTHNQRRKLLEELFIDFFANQHLTLQKWAALTGQTAQVDTGYIAQFVASIVLQEPGQGFRGKGDDLTDGSEVKSAANISGVDRPRWNHNLGSLVDDAVQIENGREERWRKYLNSPYLFYVLVDRPFTAGGKSGGVPIRIRAWCIDAQEDESWRSLILKFVESRSGRTYNFQLHPPVGHDDDLVVNTLGNLDFREVLVFDARLYVRPDGQHKLEWHKELPSEVLGIRGRTVALEYERQPSRATRLTETSDIVADVAMVPQLFASVFAEAQVEAVEEALKADMGSSSDQD